MAHTTQQSVELAFRMQDYELNLGDFENFEPVMEQAVQVLVDWGIPATFEYPGFIAVPTSDGRGMAFGDADGTEYGGNYNDGSSEGLDFAMPLDATAAQLAYAIRACIGRASEVK